MDWLVGTAIVLAVVAGAVFYGIYGNTPVGRGLLSTVVAFLALTWLQTLPTGDGGMSILGLVLLVIGGLAVFGGLYQFWVHRRTRH